jgi:hypothetical protein
MISMAPFRPQRVQSAELRNRPLDPLAPHRITSGAKGIWALWPQRMAVQ